MKKRRLKKGNIMLKGFAMLLLGMGVLMGKASSVSVYAQEIAQTSRIMTSQQEVEMKADPDESAETIYTYSAGDSIFVTGEMSGWYQVRYQDLTGYIQQDEVTEMNMDVTALDEQFAQQEEEGRMLVEEVELQRDEARRAKVWGTVIVVLVIAIFATGIVSTMKGAKRMEEKKA